MIVVLARGTTSNQADEVIQKLQGYGVRARFIEGFDDPLIHLHDGPTRAARSVLGFDCVIGLVPTSGPRIRREGRRFYPYYLINWCSAVLLMLGVLVILTGFFPPGGVGEIDQATGLLNLGTSWYLLAPANFLELFAGRPTWVGWLCLFGILVAGFFVPRLDRFARKRIRIHWLLPVLGTVAAACWVALTLKGWVY